MLIPDEEITMLYTEFPKELSDVSEKTYDLIISIIKLRQKYKEANELPLYPVNSDLENLDRLLYCIEQEILKFGVPGTISKEFYAYSKKELKEILLNKDELLNTGIDEWISEGLIKE
ncbi:MAG: hypothetical protein AB7G87_03905 [Clostridia bacterium]